MNYNRLFSTSILLLFLIITACQQPSSKSTDQISKIDPETKLDSISFALGYQNGAFLAREGATEFNFDQYLSGFVNGLEGNEKLTDDELNQIVSAFRTELRTKVKEKNKLEGEQFLADNATKEGVMVTESGLQYKIITEGSGESPEVTNTVRVNYEGSLIDGTVFDSSFEGGQPIEFPLNRVISGWTEGVQLMKEGATFEFYIPSELAYGENGAGGIIPPNATLIFKVELLEIK